MRDESLNEVVDLEVAPALVQIFGDQAAVAVVGFFFAAEEATAGEFGGVDFFFDFAFGHEVEEGAFVDGPVAAVFFVGVEERLRGREEGLFDVIDAEDFVEEVF
jgi:hypothetical protein